MKLGQMDKSHFLLVVFFFPSREVALWALFQPIVEQKVSAALSLFTITVFVLKHELPTC